MSAQCLMSQQSRMKTLGDVSGLSVLNENNFAKKRPRMFIFRGHSWPYIIRFPSFFQIYHCQVSSRQRMNQILQTGHLLHQNAFHRPIF